MISAPPGAGKTTRVPLTLIDEPWIAGRKLILVEPRRIAARAAAERMASTLGERVGWRRDMLWRDTGLPWVPASPHIPTIWCTSGRMG